MEMIGLRPAFLNLVSVSLTCDFRGQPNFTAVAGRASFSAVLLSPVPLSFAPVFPALPVSVVAVEPAFHLPMAGLQQPPDWISGTRTQPCVSSSQVVLPVEQ